MSQQPGGQDRATSAVYATYGTVAIAIAAIIAVVTLGFRGAGADTIVVTLLLGFAATTIAKMQESTHKEINSKVDTFLVMAKAEGKAEEKAENAAEKTTDTRGTTIGSIIAIASGPLSWPFVSLAVALMVAGL